MDSPPEKLLGLCGQLTRSQCYCGLGFLVQFSLVPYFQESGITMERSKLAWAGRLQVLERLNPSVCGSQLRSHHRPAGVH